MDRLVPPVAPVALPSAPKCTTASAVVDRIFRYALARPPSADEQALAEQALVDPAKTGDAVAVGACGSVVGAC